MLEGVQINVEATDKIGKNAQRKNRLWGIRWYEFTVQQGFNIDVNLLSATIILFLIKVLVLLINSHQRNNKLIFGFKAFI